MHWLVRCVADVAIAFCRLKKGQLKGTAAQLQLTFVIYRNGANEFRVGARATIISVYHCK